MNNIKKIIVIDDSAFMRRVVSDIINSDERCEVIATATNGKEGLEKIKELNPDCITLDIEMPVMNGIEMLKELQKTHHTPAIMLSTLVEAGAKETIAALELGAFDFIQKPDNIFKIKSDQVKEELIQKVIAAANSRHVIMRKTQPLMPRKTVGTSKNQKESVTRLKNNSTVNNLVAIGVSTGGPKALQYVLPYLPSNLNAGVVIVQHMPPGFTASLSNRLDQLSEISVKEAENGDVIENGKAYIAPGDKHLLVIQRNNDLIIQLSDEPPVGSHKPSVNVMMNSISKINNKKLIGVIMTGMGNDGTDGFTKVKENQKMHVIAQNEATCVVYGMPRCVVDKGLADEVVDLESIAKSISKQSGVL
jgi:two-component system chemotaxis response regulator CheB